MSSSSINFRELWKPAFIALGLAFLYATVLAKLGYDWWTDDNYSHGLLVPFVIGYIVWLKFDDLRNADRRPMTWLGLAAISASLMMLLVGTLAAELFMQRASLVVMIAGIVVYFFGTQVLRKLIVPFLLLLFAIPIPQIIFNKIAFPLQLLASRIAFWVVGVFNIASVRQGNVIEITPADGGSPIALEVVEACSGIRSLMTLITLALILGYLTSDRRRAVREKFFDYAGDFDFLRIAILVFAAVPIAVVTNAGRVSGTAILTYYYGVEAAQGLLHESAGALVFICALAMLIALNLFLKRFGPKSDIQSEERLVTRPTRVTSYGSVTSTQTVVLLLVMLAGGVFINWFEHRGEVIVSRRDLSEVPSSFGDWKHKGQDLRFDAGTEEVLRADDYVMRYYFSPETWVNFYVGYYASQRSGATYHSPLNCLPGSGWELKDSQYISINTRSGKNFLANRYTVQRGKDSHILIYWYQGRGRSTASEYKDKFYTSLDSLASRRSDGALVRMMTPVGNDEKKSLASLLDFASHIGDELSPFVPD